MIDELMTAGDASKILNIVPATVRLLADAGKLPAVRTERGMRLFRREDVERLAAERSSRGSDRLAVTPPNIATEEGGRA